MKKSVSRVIIYFLCLIMVVGMLPGAAFAASYVAGKPTNLTWGKLPVDKYDENGYLVESGGKLYNVPGMFIWQNEEPDTGSYFATVYRADGSVLVDGNWTHSSNYGWKFSDDLYLFAEESGTYYFTVKTYGNGSEIADSATVKSSSWKYTKPSKKLPGFTGIRWNGSDPEWIAPTDANMLGYQISYYYQPDLSAERVLARSFRRYAFSVTDVQTINSGPSNLQGMFADYGEGYYSFQIRALSKDITAVCHSDWSVISEPFKLVRSKIENNETYSIEDLTVGPDGYFRTPNGQLVYIAVNNVKDIGLSWLGGYTLYDYVDAYGEEYFDTSCWAALTALMDKDGYVLLNEQTLDYLRVTVLGNPDWGDTEEYLPYYLYYDKEAAAESKDSNVTRIFGSDRYATSFKAADTLKAELGVQKFQNIVVASGTGFADALAGSYLAAVKNAPILLVRGANVNDVKNYIKNNLISGGTVYLLGGVNAVSKAMETGLDGFNVKRLGGANRYDTNLLILKEAGVGDKDIIVCTGLNFADSLSASATGLPILLVKDGLYANQKEFLKSVTGDYIIVGGTGAVNTTIEKQLASYGSVKRLAGNNRYETSVLVAKEFFSAPKSAVLAYAQNFPDGLSGGPLAYALKAPLILTDNNKPTAAVNYATGLGIKSGYVLGGTGLISDRVVKNIFAMASGDSILVK